MISETCNRCNCRIQARCGNTLVQKYDVYLVNEEKNWVRVPCNICDNVVKFELEEADYLDIITQ